MPRRSAVLLESRSGRRGSKEGPKLRSRITDIIQEGRRFEARRKPRLKKKPRRRKEQKVEYC